MAKIAATKSDSGDGYTPKQPTRLLNGVYGGMFAWYSQVKTYAKFQSTETEERFYVGFVITHDRASRPLPEYSETMMTVRPKLFYSAENGMKSSYVQLLYALLGGKKSPEEIAEMNLDELPDLDDLIGRPCWLSVENGPRPDKNGVYNLRLKSLDPADRDLIAAIKPLYNSKEIEVGDKSGTARLKAPCAAYIDIGAPLPQIPTGQSADSYVDELEDEIPF
jgi:hypothetical protein